VEPPVDETARRAAEAAGERARQAQGKMENRLKLMRVPTDGQGSMAFIRAQLRITDALAAAQALERDKSYEKAKETYDAVSRMCAEVLAACERLVGSHDAAEARDAAVRAHNDAGITGLALSACLEAGYTDRDNHYALEGARVWIRKVADPVYGDAGYQGPMDGPARYLDWNDRFPREASRATHAAALAIRVWIGDLETAEAVRRDLEQCAGTLPRWEKGAVDLCY